MDSEYIGKNAEIAKRISWSNFSGKNYDNKIKEARQEQNKFKNTI